MPAAHVSCPTTVAGHTSCFSLPFTWCRFPWRCSFLVGKVAQICTVSFPLEDLVSSQAPVAILKPKGTATAIKPYGNLGLWKSQPPVYNSIQEKLSTSIPTSWWALLKARKHTGTLQASCKQQELLPALLRVEPAFCILAQGVSQTLLWQLPPTPTILQSAFCYFCSTIQYRASQDWSWHRKWDSNWSLILNQKYFPSRCCSMLLLYELLS